MKFSTRHDTDLPADQVFNALTDFARSERILARRGVELKRTEAARNGGAGMAWDLAFDLRGKRRALALEVVRFDRPENLTISGQSEPFDLTLDMTVVPLTLVKSRILVELDVRPRNIRARLLIQTARLGKSQLDRRFAARMSDYFDGVLAGAV